MRYFPPGDWWSGAAVAACVLAYLGAATFILLAPPPVGLFSDALDYLLLSDFFHGQLHAQASALGAQAFSQTRFPPLFPLQLALFGVDLHGTARAYAVTLGTGLLAVLAGVVWLKQTTGSALVAAGLVAGGLLTPRLFLFLLDIQSELLFLLLLFCSLYLCARYRDGKISLLVLCAVAALLPLCRMAGVAVLLALLVWLAGLPAPGRWRRLAAGVCMLVPTACWLLFRRHYPVAIDYLADLGRVDLSPWVWLSQAGNRLLAGLAAQFALYPGPFVYGVVGALLLLAAAGWWQRLRVWQADALVLPASLLLTLMWPYPAEDPRLLAMTTPMLALCVWQGLTSCSRSSLLRPMPRLRAALPRVTLLLVLLAAAPLWLQILQRASATTAPALASDQRSSAYFTAPARFLPVTMDILRRARALLAEVPAAVPRGECVWSALPLFSLYHANFGADFRPTPEGLTGHREPAAALAGCRYVLVLNLNAAPAFAGPLYPLATIRTFSQPLLVSRFDWQGQDTVAAALLRLETGGAVSAP